MIMMTYCLNAIGQTEVILDSLSDSQKMEFYYNIPERISKNCLGMSLTPHQFITDNLKDGKITIFPKGDSTNRKRVVLFNTEFILSDRPNEDIQYYVLVQNLFQDVIELKRIEGYSFILDETQIWEHKKAGPNLILVVFSSDNRKSNQMALQKPK